MQDGRCGGSKDERHSWRRTGKPPFSRFPIRRANSSWFLPRKLQFPFLHGIIGYRDTRDVREGLRSPTLSGVVGTAAICKVDAGFCSNVGATLILLRQERGRGNSASV